MITKDDVLRAAKLSRLALSDDEVKRLVVDLERVVSYVDEIMNVDVTGLEPMTHVHDVSTPRRPDVAGEVLGRRALEGSAGFDGALVRVPKVIE